MRELLSASRLGFDLSIGRDGLSSRSSFSSSCVDVTLAVLPFLWFTSFPGRFDVIMYGGVGGEECSFRFAAE